MSQRPFGFGNRQNWMDTYSMERAAPRAPGQGEKRYHHPVIPISSASAPHYAQASQLYPMRTSSERDSVYKYKPGSLGATGQTNNTTSSSATAVSSPTGQPVSIPVLHLSQPRSTLTQSTGYGSPHTVTSTTTSPGGSFSDTGDSGYRTPSYRTTPILSSTISRSTGRRTPVTNDQEAEVDALTNLLMQSMETKSSTSGLGSSAGSTTLTTNLDASSSSPAGSFRRGSGTNLPLSYNSQIGRLQQHLGLSSGSASLGNTNGGRGSPLTTGAAPVSGSSMTGSSSTNSPTGSTSSIHNLSDMGSVAGTVVSQGSLHNSCYRCRRALVPPEGSTLNSTATSNNVVTLTGALSVRLHVACFTCYRCAAPLRPDAYYHSLRRLLCPACVRDGAVETCSNCRRPIGDRVVHALGLPYHPNCFVCVVCASRLDCRPFTIDVHGRLHCLDDFHRRYAPRCAQCGRPISPDQGSQEARRVVSGDSNYHLECFGVQTITPPSTTKMTKSLVT